MLPCFSARIALNPLGHTGSQPLHANADYAHHLATRLPSVNENDPWFLRLLPAILRAPLSNRLAARRQEALLIATWENSPHLLDDMGIILSRDADLPDHLVAAPAAVINHVASQAPEQIVQAELHYPPRPVAQSQEPAPRETQVLTLRPARASA